MSLDLPEPLGMSFHFRTGNAEAQDVEVLVNGNAVGSIRAPADWGEARLEAPRAVWKRGPNVVTLRSPSAVQLDSVTFLRAEP